MRVYAMRLQIVVVEQSICTIMGVGIAIVLETLPIEIFAESCVR